MAVRVLPETTTAGYFGEQYIGMDSLAPPAENLLVPSDQLIMLTQVREFIDAEEHDELTDSIDRSYMMHDVSVARMTEERLGDYIAFVNELWHADHELNAYLPSADGYYYLVIAGHRRTTSGQRIADRRGHAVGIPCNIYDNMTNQEIIAHQVDENNHSLPASERQAMAIIESYYMGLKEGMWSTKAEFMAATRFTRHRVDQALAFAELPPDIRDFVFSKTLPYTLGVELGKSIHSVRTYYAEKYPQESEEEHKKAVNEWLQLRIAQIRENRYGSKRSRQFIRNHVAELENSLEEYRATGGMSLFELVLDDERRAMRNQLGGIMRHISEQPILRIAQAVQLHLKAFPGEEGEALRREMIHNGHSYLGGLGVRTEVTTDGETGQIGLSLVAG